MTLPDRNRFESAYAGQPPWDIGRPQQAFIDAAKNVTGSILDSGCGTGENALFFAKRGHEVTGIDFLEEPISRATKKTAKRGLKATFLVMDALALSDRAGVFENVIDSGLFHTFDNADRQRYVDGLTSVLKPGGNIFLLCVSDHEPGTHGPRRVSTNEIRNAFSKGWEVMNIEPTQFEVRSDTNEQPFSEGGPKAWFVQVTRK